MPDRISRSQIDRLGERIRQTDELSEDDLALLQDLRAEYDELLSSVAERLAAELGLQPGFRLKTVGTIVEKLKRESIRLSQMQDIAGVRVIVAGDRGAQDVLVAGIRELFADTHVVDRRVTPSHGYRAVHVVVTVDRRRVEIQVRTGLQHLWAQVLERFADKFGRGIRYGQPPENPGAMVGEITVQEFVAQWMRFSDVIRTMEDGDGELGESHISHALRRLLETLDVGESEM